MKRLDIRNWEKQCNDMNGNNYTIQYGVEKSFCYRLSIMSNKSRNYYQMSIDKVAREDGTYQVWIYDVDANMSYPLSIGLYELNSKGRFISFLETTIQVADSVGFSGNKGNSTTQP